MVAAAMIEAQIDSTPGANDMPGRLVFSTTADGAASPTERLRITAGGNVGIGTSSPGEALEVNGAIKAGANASAVSLYLAANSAIRALGNAADTYLDLSTGSASHGQFIIRSSNAYNERARIDSSGRLLVGTSSDFDGYLNQVSSTSGSLLSLRRTNSNPGSIKLSSGASGDNVGSGGQLGYLRWYGFHTSADYEAARISAEVDGTPGANDMPGRLVFSTTADGAATPTERMRISSAGRFQVTGPYDNNITAVAALDMDLSTSNYFTKTINANSTFTVSNTPSSRAFSFTLELTHTSGTITWFSGVEWPGGIAPSLTTGKTHLFMFITDDGGTRWRASSLTNYTT